MSSVARPGYRKTGKNRAVLMRTAATALIAASPLLYSGAIAASADGIPLTAPRLHGKRVSATPSSFDIPSIQLRGFLPGTFSLSNGSHGGDLATSNSLQLAAPRLHTRRGSGTHGVQNGFAVPMDARAGAGSIDGRVLTIDPMAVTATTEVDNSIDITVTDAETPIDIDGGQGHVVVNNTGDLTGGGGIRVTTSVFDPTTADPAAQTSFDWTSNYTAPLFDNAGNPITAPCWEGSTYICQVSDVYAQLTTTYATTVLDASQTDAQITINNGGKINFSGVYAIAAENEAGAGITIENSGDISSTQDTARRVGIHATTETYYYNRVISDVTVTDPGEYAVNAYDQLTGVTTPQQRARTNDRRIHGNDVGSIQILNNATIDMGVVDVSEIPQGYIPAYTQSEGIYARGFGGIEILNGASGTIKVGDFSNGITTVSAGNVEIQNDGRIEIGNRSAGIYAISGSQISGDIYGNAGDTTIINTGDIVGGMTKAEAAASPNANAFGHINPYTGVAYKVGSTGIRAYSLGTNVDGYGGMAEYTEILQSYGYDVDISDWRGYLPSHPAPPAGLTPEEEEEWWANFEPELKTTTTTIVNSGNITLKDVGLGVYGTGMYGDMRVYNSGAITVGDGHSRFQDNADARAAGIYLNNAPISGSADFYATNQAGGIISTGDDAVGMLARSVSGSVTLTNHGTIVIGDGGVGDHTNHSLDATYDWLFPSLGMQAVTVGQSNGQTAIGINTGSITTGDLSIGMNVVGNSGGFSIPLLPYRTTAYLINQGSVTTGHNSSGLIAGGNNTIVYNSGSVSIGDKDLSGFDLGPDPKSASSHYFGRMGYGIHANATGYSTVINNGTVTTGDSTVGISNSNRRTDWGLTVATAQGEDGIVSTGDNSVGIKAFSHVYSVLDNAGVVSVGANSVGVDLTAGSVYHDDSHQPLVTNGRAVVGNSGLIETGDNSTGVRVTGAELGHVHDFQEFDWDTGEYVDYSLTADILGEALLQNTGTIRTGANSTAVEINGYGAYGVNLYNVGTIDAGHGIAAKVNVGTGIDSTIINAGTIIGDIQLGDGDDLFLHAQNIDPENGQVLGTGNIIMDGHTIDFGGGTNTFQIRRGVISVAGGDDNLITGDNLTVEMNYGEIDARDDFITGSTAPGAAAVPFVHDIINFSTLTIDGDVSGNFRFAADVGSDGVSDELRITGNVLDGTDIGIILNPVHQLKGEVEIRPMNLGGANDAELIDVAGVTGLYADSLVGWETSYEASSGDVVINATFGLGHMGTAANAAALSAQNWLAGSLSSYDNRNIHAYTGRKGEGLAIWGYAFQAEGEIRPGSELQDLSFRQITSGFQGGVQWSQDVWGGRVSVGPMFTYGTAEANLIANSASSRSHPWAIGLNANYAIDGGLYIDATYQRMRMDVDLKTPASATQATGEAKVDGQGFNLEAGYSHRLGSGLVLEPQLQLTHTKVDIDDFATSDGIYSLTDIDGKATRLRAGLNVFKTFGTKTGSITPSASISYLNAIDGDTAVASNGVDFESDTSGSGYKAEIGLSGRHNAWDFSGRLALSKTSTTGSLLSPSMTVRYAFGPEAKTAEVAENGSQLPEIKEASLKFAQAAAPQDIAGPPVVRDDTPPAETPDATEDQPAQNTPELEPDQGSQPAEEAPGEENADIVVTGSLLQRGAPVDISPVTVITSEEMATKGLMTLGDVMNSFTQNDGLSQGKASNLLGRFTHGAEEVNFRGLGTGRTLVLVNGRRIADYPLPFGGEQNGADLGAIPFSAVANVQYLSSGASATYGSDAVGGVVNIITKRDMEQTSVDLTAGAFQEGYGKSLRASAVTGNSFAKGSFTVGAEATYSGEILASDSNYLRKNAPFNAGMVSIIENDATGMNPVVPQSACAPLGFEFDSTSSECVSEISDTISLSPSIKKLSAFFDGRYDLNDDIELFATGMAAKSWIKARSNVLFWQGVVGADDDSAAMFITRGFSEEELGVSTVKLDQFMWSGVLGAKGGIPVGSDVWYWDVAFSHGSYKTDQTSRNLKEEGIRNWILDGAATATDSPDQRYTYFVDPAFYNSQLVNNIVRPVQPADIDSLVGDNVMKASSSASTLSATLNGQLGDLGFMYKPAKFALRAEYARQTTEIDPDERSLNTTGEGWFNIGSIQANGKRNRWALAAEIDATPIDNLDIMLAARYDHYDDASSVKGRVTGQAKFLYRPTDWLKIRGGYGQTFRAPDMFNLYGESSGFEFVPDYSQPGCFDGTNYFCGYTQVPSIRRADSSLTEEHGDDIGLGAIFNPIPNFTLTVDWYRIKLKDLVITESSADLVLKEWQCDNGVLDGSSQLCADVHNRVVRNGFGAIEQVVVQPINQDSLTRQGIDIRASYKFESAKLGAFNFDLGYSKVLKFELNRFAGDEPLDLKYGEPGAATPGNGFSAGLSWYQPLTTGKAISAGLFVQRQGRVKDYSGNQFLEPFYDVNLTVGYQLNAKTQARLSVNNLLGADPVTNGSNIWPGYWAHLQNAFGRSFAISIGHSFN